MSQETLIWAGSTWSRVTFGELLFLGATLIFALILLFTRKLPMKICLVLCIPIFLCCGALSFSTWYELQAAPKTTHGRLKVIQNSFSRSSDGYFVLTTLQGDQEFFYRHAGPSLVEKIFVNNCYKVNYVETLRKRFEVIYIAQLNAQACSS